ncbi:MAG: diguanylate cyclase, partial [Planctomycetota bacterium]|nr:diguanylate cyclase [Planctomycetota bacterium]
MQRNRASDSKQAMRKPTAILLVDDDPDTVELISHAIREHDAGAVIHSCAAIADLAPIDLDELDLVLCDFHLPDGRAVDAIRILLERRDDLPIVIVTGERETAAVVEAIHQGAVDYIVKFGDYLRMIPIVIAKNLAAARLRRDNLRLQSALASSLAELKAKNRTLEQLAARLEVMASTDLLTQLDNRRRMDERLSVMFSEAVRYNRELTCMMVDLDEFKSVNDVLGHQTGDELLAITGRVIRDEIRASDIGARYGGDEFLLALPNTTHPTAAMLAKRL